MYTMGTEKINIRTKGRQPQTSNRCLVRYNESRVQISVNSTILFLVT